MNLQHHLLLLLLMTFHLSIAMDAVALPRPAGASKGKDQTALASDLDRFFLRPSAVRRCSLAARSALKACATCRRRIPAAVQREMGNVPGGRAQRRQREAEDLLKPYLGRVDPGQRIRVSFVSLPNKGMQTLYISTETEQSS
ncbi:hypothetical protein AOLI_G00117360 [Acnodon oligacanthus]